MIHFETERLILRNYTMDDVPAVHEYFSSEEVSRYEDFWPQTVEEVAEGLSEWKDMDNRMAVVLKETGELIGSAGYWDDEEDEDGETEYSIDFDFNPRFWHKGIRLRGRKRGRAPSHGRPARKRDLGRLRREKYRIGKTS